MAQSIGRFAIVGLGKMGGSLTLNAIRAGFEIVGVDPKGVPQELAQSGVISGAMGDLKMLPRPRFVMLYVPAGPIVDELLDELSGSLEAGDIIADGGNSYWGDSIRRHARLKERGLHFIDVGRPGVHTGRSVAAVSCSAVSASPLPRSSRSFAGSLSRTAIFTLAGRERAIL